MHFSKLCSASACGFQAGLFNAILILRSWTENGLARSGLLRNGLETPHAKASSVRPSSRSSDGRPQYVGFGMPDRRTPPQSAAPARWDAPLGLPEDDGKLNLVAKRRSKHGLEVGLRVRAGLVVEPAVNDLLLAALDALSLEGVDVAHVDVVEDVVSLLQHARLAHVRRVGDHIWLVKRDRELVGVALVLGKLGALQVDSSLYGAAVALPEAVGRPGQVDEVKKTRRVRCLVDDGVVLRGADQLVLRHHALEHH